MSLRKSTASAAEAAVPDNETGVVKNTQVDSGPRIEVASESLASSTSIDNEKRGEAVQTTKAIDDEADVEVDADLEDENDPEISQLPLEVRRAVSLHDDPTLPTITFRYFVLSIIFIIPGAFLSQMNAFRTTYAPYSVFFVQIASNYVGLWLARILPAWTVRIPGTPMSWEFSLNPGPWSIKEHVLVTVTAASGATGNQGASAIAIADLYYGQKVHPAAAIFFMWAIDATGYSLAAIARQLLLYEPSYPWFYALCQSALFETQRKNIRTPSKSARKQMFVFWGVLIGMTLWQFLPEYIFPMTSSLAFLCWVAPNNPVANFVGSGLGGMGFLNLSLDWANISNYNSGVPLFLSPWHAQVVLFVSFVFCAWILLPAAKYGGLGYFHEGLMSNRLLLTNGTKYPIAQLVTPQNTFNETAYEINGPIWVGTQQLWTMFFDYASYSSAIIWIAFFGAPQLKAAYRKFMDRRKSAGKGINHQYTDRLNVLMRAYKEVPLWWYGALFLVSFVILLTIIATGILFIPVWTYFVALATGIIIVIPLGWLYALTTFQLPIGTTNELLYGAMVQNISGFKNPVGANVYGSIAGDAWYRAQYMLQDQKIGHYTHTPQRAIFFSQVFGIVLGVPINYAAMQWIVDTKRPFLTGDEEDPAHIWTGQQLASSVTTGLQYVLIGPTRLFGETIFRPVPHGFLAGAILPMVIYALHRAFPRAKFNLWNTTIFFSGAATFYGNVSTGYFSRFIGGYVVMYWAYRYRYRLWSKYNFILAAATDAGFNFNMLLVFLAFGSGVIIKAPFWWGNNEDSAERCFALDS